MVEKLRPDVPEKKPPFLIRNALVARGIAAAVDWRVGNGLTKDGHILLRKIIVKALQGTKVSIAKDVFRVCQGAKLAVEVDGQRNIPTSGPTVFIGNHTFGGPLYHMGQFFQMVKEGYDSRSDVEEDGVREPFMIVQRGLAQGRIMQYLSGVFYEVVGGSFSCEMVEIPSHNKEGEIVNSQNLKDTAITRVTADGGASLWLPQGTHREPDDLRFPEKGTGFLRKINNENSSVQLVPVRSIPDPHGNVKLVFGPAVDVNHVVANGGINYFAEKHISPLK